MLQQKLQLLFMLIRDPISDNNNLQRNIHVRQSIPLTLFAPAICDVGYKYIDVS